MKITSKFRMTARLSGTDLALKPLLCSNVPVISRLLKYKLCPPPFVSRVLLSWQLVDPYRYESIIIILRGTRNLSFVSRRSLLRTFETIWILVITLEYSNITGSKSIRRERKMRPMELSGFNFSTHGSESECSCFDQVLCIRV